MIEELLDHYRIFDTGNHLHGATAGAASLNVDDENALELLCSGHRARRCAGVGGSSATLALFPLPRLAGVTRTRCRLFGANTPWKRVKFTRGFGTSAASRAMESSGSKITWMVPYREDVLSWWRTLPLGVSDKALFRYRRAADLAAQPFQLLAFIGPGRHPGMQREPGNLTCSVIERFVTARRGL